MAHLSYTYNDEGIRTSKTVNGVKHEYVLEGSTILYEKYNDVIVIYFYYEAGLPIGMAYRKTSEANLELSPEDQFEYFLFTKNLQGDILNIYADRGLRTGDGADRGRWCVLTQKSDYVIMKITISRL